MASYSTRISELRYTGVKINYLKKRSKIPGAFFWYYSKTGTLEIEMVNLAGKLCASPHASDEAPEVWSRLF